MTCNGVASLLPRKSSGGSPVVVAWCFVNLVELAFPFPCRPIHHRSLYSYAGLIGMGLVRELRNRVSAQLGFLPGT